MQEEVDKQKARKHTSPVLQELMSEITPEEMEVNRKEMEWGIWNTIWVDYIGTEPKDQFDAVEFLCYLQENYKSPKPLKDE